MSSTEETVTEAWGMTCPRCGQDDRIEIQLTTWALLTSDGTDIHAATTSGDHEWHPRSQACCTACDHYGTVANFTKGEKS